MSEENLCQSQISVFILENVEAHPKEIVTFTANQFGVTRQAVLKHIRNLVATEKLGFSGITRDRVYTLKSENWFKEYPLGGKLNEDRVWKQDILPQMGALPDNVRNIWAYGFTKMLNNAIDHSEGSSVMVSLIKNAVWQEIIIQDNGVGIFKKIQHVFDLDDENHAVLELTKGKLTTDARRHSGEGIFFTSRCFDRFAIVSGSVQYLHSDHQEGDYVFGTNYLTLDHKGTAIFLRLANNSTRSTKAVFDMFTTENDGELEFNKTIIPIRLAFLGDDMLVSRSQAKRLLNRFERFKIVVLDFEGVHEIGQGFADEIFRVFPNFHPATEIHECNANEQVQKMISRAKNACV